MALHSSIQRGSVTLNSDNTDTNVTISAVTLARAWLICTVRSPAGNPSGYQLSYHLSSTTNIQLRVATRTTANVVVEWQVIEFTTASGITVQHGTWTTETSITISTVTIASSMVQANLYKFGSAFGGDDWIRPKITGTTTLTTNDNNTDTKWYQIVDWGSHANVQHVDISIGTGDTGTKDTTITTLTDYTKTVVIGQSEIVVSSFGNDVGNLYCTSNTNLRFIRSGGARALTVTAQVIEFTESNINVQQFITTIGTSTTTATATLTTVNTSNTLIIPGSAFFNWARANIANDDAGHFSVTYTLTNSTTVTLTKSTTGNTTIASFSVLEFDVTTEQEIVPTGIASVESFGSAVLTTGNVNLVPTGIASVESFGSAVLTTGNVNLVPTGIASVSGLGSATLTQGAVSLAPTPITSDETFGSATLALGAVEIIPSGIGTDESFGNSTLSYHIHPNGLTSQESVPSPVVLPPTSVLFPAGIPTAEALGTTTQVSTGAVVVVPNGTESAEAFGNANITTGAVPVLPSGISSGEAVGSPTIYSLTAYILPNGIPGEEAYGSPSLSTGNINVSPDGVLGQAQVGSPIVQPFGAIYIYVDGIVSAEAVPVPNVYGREHDISFLGIVSAENVPIPAVSTPAWVIDVTGIGSAEFVSDPLVVNSITPAGIAGAEDFGVASLTGGGVGITPVGVVSAEDFGLTVVRNLWVLAPTGIISLEAVQSVNVTSVSRSSLMTQFETDLDNVFFGNEFEFAENASYEHKNGITFVVKGIFDNEYTALDVESGAEIMSSTPVFWMQTSKFKEVPKAGDKMVIRGIRFKVTDSQPDGTGVSMLFLHRENVL